MLLKEQIVTFVRVISLFYIYRRVWYFMSHFTFQYIGTYYSIYVDLTVPKSSRNRDLVKFMISAKAISADGYSIAKSARPVVLPYQSNLSIMFDSIVNFPLHLLGTYCLSTMPLF